MSIAARQDILDLLDAYLEVYPDEVADYLQFTSYVKGCAGKSYCDRKNFRGHLTVSSFIFSPCGDSVLMLHHRGLGRWLQPGGHLEPTDPTLAAAVYREIEEETGLTADALRVLRPRRLYSISRGSGKQYSRATRFGQTGTAVPTAAGLMRINLGIIPIGLNSHPIPANDERQEECHTHYDLRFAFQLEQDQPKGIVLCERESEGYRWVSLKELSQDPDFSAVVAKADDLDLERCQSKKLGVVA